MTARDLAGRVFAVLDDGWRSAQEVAASAQLGTYDTKYALGLLLAEGRVERSRLGRTAKYFWRRRTIERTPPSRYEDQ